MSTFLITGRSGTGKSTLCQQLRKRGLQAFDSDKIAGLASWVERATGKTATNIAEAAAAPEHFAWKWNGKVLHQFLSENSHGDLFLCGSADNQLEFHSLFDKVFVLTLEPEEQRRRIRTRAEHNYGKTKVMEDYLITEQASFVNKATSLGATLVNADPAPELIVNKILELIDAA